MVREFSFQLAQRSEDPLPGGRCLVQQVFLFEHLQTSPRRRGADRVATVRTGHVAGLGIVQEGQPSYNGRYRKAR